MAAALGLLCCAWVFSSCGEQGLLFVVVHVLLIAVASLVFLFCFFYCFWNGYFYFFNFYFINLFILFLAVLGLCCCAQAFSSCSEWGLLFVAVHRLLIVVASLVAEHGL